MKRRIPTLRLHKPTGQAVVRLDGRDIYLGRHGTEASQEKYRRVVAEWLSSGAGPTIKATSVAMASVRPTINELILAYWRHAESYYRRPDGTPTSEPDKIKLAVRPLKNLYGMTLAEDFGPRSLKALRDVMVGDGLCRLTVNQRIGIVVRLFRYGVENEMIPPSVHQALKAVGGLRAGRSAAREGKVVLPVADSSVEAIKPFVTRQIWSMIELQRLTGMRSGEVTILRTCDLDRLGDVWTYIPSQHKTQHHGRKRIIHLGPRAQEILTPWLREDPTAYLFQPREAIQEARAERRRNRTSPLTPSQRARRPMVRPQRSPGNRYNSQSYGHAIAKACSRACPHPTLSKIKGKDLTTEQRLELVGWRKAHRWHSHQLRHSSATRLRREFGLDTARAILGHSSATVTEGYTELDSQKAAEVMKQIG